LAVVRVKIILFKDSLLLLLSVNRIQRISIFVFPSNQPLLLPPTQESVAVLGLEIVLSVVYTAIT